MSLFNRHAEDDEVEGWARDLTRKDSYPGLAIGAAVAVVFAVSIAAAYFLPQHDMFLGPVRIALISALLAWAIAFAVTIRYADMTWKVASGGILLFAGLLAAVCVIGARMNAMRDDMLAVSEITLDPQGLAKPPEGGARGPISATTFAYLKMTTDDVRNHMDAMRALGYARMHSPAELAQQPEPLAHCDKRATADPEIDDFYARRRTAMVHYRAAIAALDIDDRLKTPMLRGMDDARRRQGALLTRLATNEHAQLGELADICAVLAKRHWRAQFGSFGFTSMADLAEHRRHAERLRALGAEDQALEDADAEQMRASMSAMRRGLLF